MEKRLYCQSDLTAETQRQRVFKGFVKVFAIYLAEKGRFTVKTLPSDQ